MYHEEHKPNSPGLTDLFTPLDVTTTFFYVGVWVKNGIALKLVKGFESMSIDPSANGSPRHRGILSFTQFIV